MPPRKAVPKQDDNPGDLMLAYLKAQNRPYSAIDISSNLHNKVTKAKADKILKELAESGKIMWPGRDAKVKVYWAIQDPADAATPEELAAFDVTITTLREAIPQLKATNKAKAAALNKIKSAMTTEALRDAVESLGAKKGELEARLSVLREGDVKPITKEERDKVDERLRYWTKKSVARKRVWLELEGMLREGMEREELYDKLGIDYD